MNIEKFKKHLEQLNKRDDREDLTYLQASFEWAKRRPVICELPMWVLSVPLGLLSGGGALGVPATLFEKYMASVNSDLAYARYYERKENAADAGSESAQNYAARAAEHRVEFQKRYAWALKA